MSKYNTTSIKRARCSNFTPFEETTLVSLVVKHSKVLECKKSDHDIWEAKKTVWTQIDQEFTAATGNKREIQNLKDKYENLKRKTKKIEGNRKKEMFQTGGGVSAYYTVARSETQNLLLGILGESAVGLQNPFDGDKPGKPLITADEDVIIVNNLNDENDSGDYRYVDINLEPETSEMDVSIVPVEVELVEAASNIEENDLNRRSGNWAKWNPETLKTKKSDELTTPLSIRKNIKSTLGESVKKYSIEKIELIAQQKRYLENEERRAQEKHDAEQLRAQEKHEWERVHYELMIEKLKHEINDLKKSKYTLYFNFN